MRGTVVQAEMPAGAAFYCRGQRGGINVINNCVKTCLHGVFFLP